MENGFDTKKEIKKTNKATLIRLMKENGIDRIELEFDGSGDEGQIEVVCLLNENETEIENSLLNLPCETINYSMRYSDGEWICDTKSGQDTLENLAETIAYDHLESDFGGWEINDGSYGTISIHADGTGYIECNERIMDVNTTAKTF